MTSERKRPAHGNAQHDYGNAADARHNSTVPAIESLSDTLDHSERPPNSHLLFHVKPSMTRQIRPRHARPYEAAWRLGMTSEPQRPAHGNAQHDYGNAADARHNSTVPAIESLSDTLDHSELRATSPQKFHVKHHHQSHPSKQARLPPTTPRATNQPPHSRAPSWGRPSRTLHARAGPKLKSALITAALITATLLALSMAATACRTESVSTARPGAQTPPPSTAHSTSPSAPTIRARALPLNKTAPPNSTGWMKVKATDNLAATIRTAVASAQAAKLKAIAYLSADWCEPCRAIKKHRQHPLMLPA